MSSKNSDQPDDVEAIFRDLTAWARENCTYEELVHRFAKARIEADLCKEKVYLQDKLRTTIEPLEEEIQRLYRQQLEQVERNYKAIATQAIEQGLKIGAEIVTKTQKSAAKKRGQFAADIRHNKPGGSRSKVDEIRLLWASGKFDSRDACAEQECSALGMSYSSARKALRGTPSPT